MDGDGPGKCIRERWQPTRLRLSARTERQHPELLVGTAVGGWVHWELDVVELAFEQALEDAAVVAYPFLINLELKLLPFLSELLCFSLEIIYLVLVSQVSEVATGALGHLR
eukprot:1849461-Pyramimonas_sp.AAC.1